MHANQIPSSLLAALALTSTARAGTTASRAPVASGLAGLSPRQRRSRRAGRSRRGDRLAICGDSITEQKQYSRIMEDYLTMCVPELGVSVRQFGWVARKRPASFAA